VIVSASASLQVNTPQPPSLHKWWALLGVCIGLFMSTLDTSIVNVALPTLSEELNASFTLVQWVVLAYMLVLTSMMLVVARLCDMRDKKRLHLLGVGIFSASSLLCGLAPSVEALIVFRACQGLGAALMQAVGSAMITEIFPARERGRALGIISASVSFGVALGPPLGGVVIGILNWRWLFLINVPVGLVAVYLLRRYIPHLVPTCANERFDFLGAIILFITLSCYATGITMAQEGSGGALPPYLLGVALVGVVIFIIYEWRTHQPLVDLRILRNVVLSINLLMTFLVFIVRSSVLVLPFFLEYVQDYTAAESGVMLMTIPVTMFLIAPWAGYLSDILGTRVLSLVGLMLIVMGCATISSVYEGITPLDYVLRLIPFGIGAGLFQSPNNSAIMGAVPRDRLGIGSGFLSLSRSLGQTSGLLFAGWVFTSAIGQMDGISGAIDVSTASNASIVAGVSHLYSVAGVIVFVAALLAAVALWLDHERNRAYAG
jgi:EmrB/QacA subfamily drug resistance transporter